MTDTHSWLPTNAAIAAAVLEKLTLRQNRKDFTTVDVIPCDPSILELFKRCKRMNRKLNNCHLSKIVNCGLML